MINVLIWGLGPLGAALVVTTVVQVVVAAMFGLRGRSLGAVVLVNVVANTELGFGLALVLAVSGYFEGVATGLTLPLVTLIVLTVVVIVEWRLLVWALGRTAGSPKRLLALSIVMNAASTVLPVAAIFGIAWFYTR